MRYTPEEQQKIVEFFASHGVKPHCTFCGSQAVVPVRMTSAPVHEQDGGVGTTTGPLMQLVCGHCGHLMHFDTTAMKL